MLFSLTKSLEFRLLVAPVFERFVSGGPFATCLVVNEEVLVLARSWLLWSLAVWSAFTDWVTKLFA